MKGIKTEWHTITGQKIAEGPVDVLMESYDVLNVNGTAFRISGRPQVFLSSDGRMIRRYIVLEG